LASYVALPAEAEADRLVVIVNGFVAVPKIASVTPAVKLEIKGFGTAGALGVPEMRPAAFRLRPAGRAPSVVAHVYGEVPPLAARVWL